MYVTITILYELIKNIWLKRLKIYFLDIKIIYIGSCWQKMALFWKQNIPQSVLKRHSWSRVFVYDVTSLNRAPKVQSKTKKVHLKQCSEERQSSKNFIKKIREIIKLQSFMWYKVNSRYHGGSEPRLGFRFRHGGLAISVN